VADEVARDRGAQRGAGAADPDAHAGGRGDDLRFDVGGVERGERHVARTVQGTAFRERAGTAQDDVRRLGTGPADGDADHAPGRGDGRRRGDRVDARVLGRAQRDVPDRAGEIAAGEVRVDVGVDGVER